MRTFVVRPDPEDGRLTRLLDGVDQDGAAIEARVVEERPLTLFLNGQEIVTVMTIRDYPEYLALGYLLNQNMLRHDDEVTGIDYDEDIETVVVRTERARPISRRRCARRPSPRVAPKALSSAT